MCIYVCICIERERERERERYILSVYVRAPLRAAGPAPARRVAEALVRRAGARDHAQEDPRKSTIVIGMVIITVFMIVRTI